MAIFLVEVKRRFGYETGTLSKTMKHGIKIIEMKTGPKRKMVTKLPHCFKSIPLHVRVFKIFHYIIVSSIPMN